MVVKKYRKTKSRNKTIRNSRNKTIRNTRNKTIRNTRNKTIRNTRNKTKKIRMKKTIRKNMRGGKTITDEAIKWIRGVTENLVKRSDLNSTNKTNYIDIINKNLNDLDNEVEKAKKNAQNAAASEGKKEEEIVKLKKRINGMEVHDTQRAARVEYTETDTSSPEYFNSPKYLNSPEYLNSPKGKQAQVIRRNEQILRNRQAARKEVAERTEAAAERTEAARTEAVRTEAVPYPDNSTSVDTRVKDSGKPGRFARAMSLFNRKK